MTAGRRRSLRSAAGVLAACCVVAACGGDDGDAVPSAPSVTFATVPSDGTDAPTTMPATAPPATTDPAGTPSSSVAPPSTTPPSTAPASTAPPSTEPLGDPRIALEPVASARQPVDLAWRTGDETLFVVEQSGRVRPLRDGVLGETVLDITDRTAAEGERGLLGLTFHPDGDRAYVNHTDRSGDTVIAEYSIGPDGSFDPTSRRELLVVDQPYPNHNGGNVGFGPDGMLYVGMGDGGSGGDPERYALNVSSLLGKILRIDPTPSAALPYTIPDDNPFVGVPGARGEIWSVGVRNPWRMSFDRATGDLWIADVGQNVYEEISVAWAADGGGRGVNFGWSAYEGFERFNEDQSPDGVTPPIHVYEHGDAGCSVTGGPVYRGAAIPELVGWYLYGDYCSGNVVGLRIEDRAVADTILLVSAGPVSAIREDPSGELWVLTLDGTVSRVVRAG